MRLPYRSSCAACSRQPSASTSRSRGQSAFRGRDSSRKGELSRSIELASADRAAAAAILVVFDSDDDCPAELARELHAREAGGARLPVGVVMAEREYEGWLLGGLESLRGSRGISEKATAPATPESIRNAKRELTRCMVGTRRYVPVTDQPALSERLDLDLAVGRCRSRGKLRRELLQLAELALKGVR